MHRGRIVYAIQGAGAGVVDAGGCRRELIDITLCWIYIQCMNKYVERLITPLLQEALDNFRIVSLTGARQTGKTTLAKQICARRGMRYVSLEDAVVRTQAAADPDGWLAGFHEPVAIDEVQQVPELFGALKRRVDTDRRPGQYLITGSALWLSMKAVGESLAGRVGLLELWPFSLAERLGRRPPDIARLADAKVDPARMAAEAGGVEEIDREWLERMVLPGGYPEPCGFKSARQRRVWFESYLNTYLQRDVLDLVRIEHADLYVRMIRLLAVRSGQLLNLNAVARDVGLPQPTARRYAQWLVTTYQRFEVAPYSTNVGKRLVRTPKSYWSDAGMVAALAGWRSWADVESAGADGALIETWVAGELRKWAAGTQGGTIYFWRSHHGGEVDFLVETDQGIVGIEVKAGRRVDTRDLRGMRECRAALGRRFRRGIVLYGGKEVLPLEREVVAVPLSILAGL